MNYSGTLISPAKFKRKYRVHSKMDPIKVTTNVSSRKVTSSSRVLLRLFLRHDLAINFHVTGSSSFCRHTKTQGYGLESQYDRKDRRNLSQKQRVDYVTFFLGQKPEKWKFVMYMYIHIYKFSTFHVSILKKKLHERYSGRIHGKDGFAEVSKYLVKYRFDNNFVGSSKCNYLGISSMTSNVVKV